MKISEAQQEVRSVYLGAFSGLIVTGAIWLLSAAAGVWMSTGLATGVLIPLGLKKINVDPALASAAFVTGFTEYWPLVIGSVIIFVVLFMPGGVLGLAEARTKWFRSRRFGKNLE